MIMFFLTKQYLKRNNWRFIRFDGSLTYAIKELYQVIKSDITNNAKYHMTEDLYEWFREEKILIDQFVDLFERGKLTKTIS